VALCNENATKETCYSTFFSYLNILITGQTINYMSQEQSRPPRKLIPSS